MNPFQHTTTSIIAINVKLLSAAAAGSVAWFIWPSRPQEWALGLVSVILAFAAVGLLMEALKLMVKLYVREAAIAQYLAQGPRPKAAEIVSTETLHQVGMLDD